VPLATGPASEAKIGADGEALERAERARTGVAPGGAPATGTLGFGCAGLMQSPSGRLRQRLLGEAFEQGIRHFDVARMYGLGAAERELGQFARGRRDRLVIATKFGIEAGGATGRLAPLQAPARAVIARFPALRRALKRRADAFHQPHRYDPQTARTSLQRSLRELGTDYVDIFFVHGPAVGETLDLDALGETLEQLRAAGQIRAWGFAGDPDPCIELSRKAGSESVLQIHDDILRDSLGLIHPPRPAITFGVLAAALGQIRAHVASGAERRTRWAEAIGTDCADPEALATLLLQDALARNNTGTVLFSSTRPERVRLASATAAALSREPQPHSLQAFRELVRRELQPNGARTR
jgi:hypothetical protein